MGVLDDILRAKREELVQREAALPRPLLESRCRTLPPVRDFEASLRPESTNELERLTKLLNDVPTLKIEISGHTDSKGADDYNKKLSDNRAKSVVDYLLKTGIATDRLTYKGYGEEQPVASNDTEEGRQQNRRTEFKVLSK